MSSVVDEHVARSASPNIDPAAQPLFFPGSVEQPGFVLLHGLSASPTEVAPLARFLHDRFSGATISCPLLPGHGTSPEDLRQTDPADWSRATAEAVRHVRATCNSICVAGVSMGAVLAIEAALTNPRVQSLVLLAPMFDLPATSSFLLRLWGMFSPYKRKSRRSIENHHVKGLFSYDRYPLVSLRALQHLGRRTRGGWGELRIPVFLAAGGRDPYLSWSSFSRLCAELQRSRDLRMDSRIEVVECPDSGHVLPHEPDAAMLFDAIERFLRHALPPPSAAR